MIDNIIYQKIFEEICRYAPETWEKIIIYLEYGEASYSFSFYIKTEGRFVKCFDLPDVSEKELNATFKKIDKVVSKARDNEKDPWSNMTMTVDNKGNMHTDFDYTDLLSGTYQFKKNWKKKYLK